jgi:SagB-type dehydrogenase family enzyme
MSRRYGLASVALAILVFAGYGVLCAAVSAAETANAKVESTAAAAGGEVVKLAPPATTGGGALNDALMKRRSIRSYDDVPVSKEQLSQILWAAQGITDPKTHHRTAPSAMAMYPLDVYAVTPDGIYLYVPADHSLKTVKTGDHRSEVTSQSWAQKAGLQIVIVGVPDRMRRGGDRAKAWITYEAGAVAENVLLEATALGLGSGTIGGFDAAKVSDLFGLPAGNEAIIVLPVGKMAAPK